MPFSKMSPSLCSLLFSFLFFLCITRHTLSPPTYPPTEQSSLLLPVNPVHHREHLIGTVLSISNSKIEGSCHCYVPLMLFCQIAIVASCQISVCQIHQKQS
ncbi:hypothetical protein RND81_10G013300 [Saponaria officinalis]|uniref:Secreted protein n=1 Tax=Saponaria officinalis TaxID=3572 RepID=A0AAW1HY05_SAPOF